MNDNTTPRPGPSRRQLLQAGTAAVAAGAGASLFGAGSARAATPATTAAAVTVDLAKRGTPFPHVWEKAIGGDHAQQVLRRDYQDQLFQCHDELGIQSLRFHGVLNDRNSLYINPAINAFIPRPASFTQDAYSFFNVDQMYGALVDHGMHPFVELSDMPSLLAANPTENFFFFYPFNPSPPADFKAWGSFVGDFVRHMVKQFGLAEVRKWPFEVWNEPNLPFYDGDETSYFQLYQYAAEAIKNVDSGLQVGGPATSGGQTSFGGVKAAGPVFYRHFMDYVSSHNVPIDFGSAHGYETDDGVGPEGPASFFKQNRADTPAGVALYISETNASASLGDSNLDQSYAAASFLKTVINSNGVVDALSYWTFSDIFEELSQADNPFYGGFGLVTIHGIKKPAYRLLEILHKVGDTRIPLNLSGAPATVGGVAITRGGHEGVDVLLYNHAIPSGKSGVPATPAQPATITVSVTGVRPSDRAKLRLIDADHANPYQEWLDLGSPEYPTKAQLSAIADASNMVTQNLAVTHNPRKHATTFTITLAAEAVAAIHLS